VVDKPSRGEVWYVDLAPVEGHEQGRTRPCVVVSDDIYNHGPSGLVALVPITRTAGRVPLHVPIQPPEGGIRAPSVIMCDQVRTVSLNRVSDRWGIVSAATLRLVDDRIRVFLSLM
jgi:mRNA interferase MazF